MAQKLDHAGVGDIRGLQLASFPPSPPPLLDASLGVVLCPDYGTTSTEKLYTCRGRNRYNSCNGGLDTKAGLRSHDSF